MKKGLRPLDAGKRFFQAPFERGPDEEGIETFVNATRCGRYPRSNADLMKKGLRRESFDNFSRTSPFERGPDEEGIETPRPPTTHPSPVRTRT